MSQTSYTGDPDEILDPEFIRHLRSNPQSVGEPLRQLQSASVQIPDKTRTALVQVLREVLIDYLDASVDIVGLAFHIQGSSNTSCRFETGGCSSQASFCSIKTLADTLTRGAAVLGPDRIADLVDGWVSGKPVVYRTSNVIPLALSHPLAPISGVDIVPLPLSTNELPDTLPMPKSASPSEFLGQTVISVETSVTPALFRASGDSPSGSVQAAFLPPVTLHNVRDALSLECNTHIPGGLNYHYYRDFAVLAEQGTWIGTLGRFNDIESRTISPAGEETLVLPHDAVFHASDSRMARLITELAGAQPRTRVAVSRWVAAMNRYRTLTDRFIDVRIVLESLFLPQQPDQELKFRLTISGAWLLGQDGPGRRTAYKTLSDAYKAGSRAVHQGSVDKKTNTDLLEKVLALCRQGIFHVLSHGPVGDWTGLILDHRDP